jgi:general secretion pathway protein B
MSYILDALRKAEMERELSRVPGISSRQHFANAVSRFPAKHWLLVAGALLLGMAITWFWIRYDAALQQQTPVSATENEGAGPGAIPVEAGAKDEKKLVKNELADVRPVMRITKSAEATPKSEPAVMDVGPAAPVLAGENMLVTQSASQPDPLPEQQSVAEPDPVMAEAPPQDKSPIRGGAGDVVAMIAAEADRGWVWPAPKKPAQPDPEAVIDDAAADAAKQEGEAEEALPPLLSTLPYRFQSTLPKIVINAQAYADEVADRFVIINMKKYHEGEQTQDGIVVESIGKDFLLLNYQGQPFRLQR